MACEEEDDEKDAEDDSVEKTGSPFASYSAAAAASCTTLSNMASPVRRRGMDGEALAEKRPRDSLVRDRTRPSTSPLPSPPIVLPLMLLLRSNALLFAWFALEWLLPASWLDPGERRSDPC